MQKPAYNTLQLVAIILLSYLITLQLAEFVYFLLNIGDRLMFIGDDWSELNFYVGLTTGKYSLLNLFDHAGTMSMNKQTVTRVFTLLAMKFGNGTVLPEMVRGILLQLGSTAIVSYAILNTKDISMSIKMFFVTLTCIAFTEDLWIGLLYVAQHQGWSLTIFFSFLAILFLTKYEENLESNKQYYWLAAIFIAASLSLYSWTNGLYTLPLLLFLGWNNAIHKKLSWKMIAFIIGMASFLTITYFNYFAGTGGNLPFYKQPINFLYYFLQLIGEPFTSHMGRPKGALIGFGFAIILAIISFRYVFTYQKLNKSQTILFGTTLFIVGSLGLTAAGRVGWVHEAEGLPPLRYPAIPITFWSMLSIMLISELSIYKKTWLVNSAAILTILFGYYSVEKFNLFNNSVKDPSGFMYTGEHSAVRNNIALAIGGGSINSVNPRDDFKRHIPPVMHILEEYKIGPMGWHETKWLGKNIHKDFDKSSFDCAGKVKKEFYYYHDKKPSLAYDGYINIENFNPDLIFITNESNNIIGLGITLYEYRNFRDYFLKRNKKKDTEWFGAALWPDDLNKLTAWGYNKKSNSVCKAKEILIPSKDNFR